MYKLYLLTSYRKRYKALTKNNEKLKKKIRKTMDLLREDPYYPSLKTHRANSRIHGYRYSSWVTGDVRIVWDYDEDDTLLLLLFSVGSHSGKNKVYS